MKNKIKLTNIDELQQLIMDLKTNIGKFNNFELKTEILNETEICLDKSKIIQACTDVKKENKDIKLRVSQENPTRILSLEDECRIRIVKKIFETIEIQLDECIKNKVMPNKFLLDAIVDFQSLLLR